jgi:hypothetical protein
MAESESRRPQEIILLALVALTAIVANLPGSLLAPLGIKPGYLLAVLGCVVVIALFLYLRFFFFLLYALLAIGANLPAQWAEELGVSQLLLLVTLAVMVGLSLLNYAVKLLPSGLEAPTAAPKHSAEGTKALLAAIERGNAQQVRQILELGIDPSQPGESGLTPLMLAARAGQAAIVEDLLAAGAEIGARTPDGQTARDFALGKGYPAIVTRLTPTAR